MDDLLSFQKSLFVLPMRNSVETLGMFLLCIPMVESREKILGCRTYKLNLREVHRVYSNLQLTGHMLLGIPSKMQGYLGFLLWSHTATHSNDLREEQPPWASRIQWRWNRLRGVNQADPGTTLPLAFLLREPMNFQPFKPVSVQFYTSCNRKISG